MSDVSFEEFKPIDIKYLACRVSPTLGKIIPKFMYAYFKKILHIDELNAFLSEHFNDDAQTFLESVVKFLDIKVELLGNAEEKFQTLKNSPVMFASNHPYGGPEAMALFNIIHKYFPDSKLLAQGFLQFIKPLSSCCVYNKKKVATLAAAVKEKKSLLFYPAGYCSRKLSFKDIFDFEWIHSFVKIAKKNNMPIVVFFTDGSLSKRMLKWTRFRQIFHIKTSIETMYLVDEMFRMRGSTLKMTCGDIIWPEKLSDNITNTEWAARIRQYCYGLKNNSCLNFDYSLPATLPLK